MMLYQPLAGSFVGDKMSHPSKHLRKRIASRDNCICTYCARKKCKAPFIRIDHITPKKAGGTDNTNNLTTSCARCNYLKASHSLTDFLTLAKQKKKYHYDEYKYFTSIVKTLGKKIEEGLCGEDYYHYGENKTNS